MRPVYQGCMERGIQHVAGAAVAGATGVSMNRMTSHTTNGKVKSSWEYATSAGGKQRTARERVADGGGGQGLGGSQQYHRLTPASSQQTQAIAESFNVSNSAHATTIATNRPAPSSPALATNNNSNQQPAAGGGQKKKKKSKRLVPKSKAHWADKIEQLADAFSLSA